MPPAIRIGGAVNSKSAYDFTPAGPDTDELVQQKQHLRSGSRASCPSWQDVTSDLQIKNPRVNVEIDRDRAAAAGSTAQRMQNALYDAFGPQLGIHHLLAHQSQYHVLLEVVPQVPGATPTICPRSICKSNTGVAGAAGFAWRSSGRMPARRAFRTPASFPSVTISFNLKPGFSLGERWTDKSETPAKRILPANIPARFSGNAAAFQVLLRNLSTAVPGRDRGGLHRPGRAV